MLVGVQVSKGDNTHITIIFLNAGLARKEEAGKIEDESQEHRDIKDYLKG
jgi:GMP synthase PP-ATPase subunit